MMNPALENTSAVNSAGLPYPVLMEKSLKDVAVDFTSKYNSTKKVLLETGKIGAKGGARYIQVMAVTVLLNLVLFFTSIALGVRYGFEWSDIKYVFLVLALAIVFVIFTSIKTYQYIIIKALEEFYPDAKPLVFKLFHLTVVKTEQTIRERDSISNEQLKSAISFGFVINEYYQGLPRLIKKGLIFLMNRIPVYPMLLELREDIKDQRTEQASIKLFVEADKYIQNYFGENTTKWLYWLIPLNVVVILTTVYFTLIR